MSEIESIKQFVAEHPITDYALPADNIILSKVADTPEYLREYFMWKGEKRAIDVLRRIATDMAEARVSGKKYVGRDEDAV